MLRFVRLLPAAPLLMLGACVAPTGPVEVTRFHVADTAALAGTVAVEAAPGMDPASLELRTFEGAVGRELQRAGYREVAAPDGAQVAEVRLERRSYKPDRNRSPVSVGMGGSAGSYGSGVGVGVGIDLSGPPPEMTETLLGVMIRERATRKVLWEGRASFTVRTASPLASSSLGAAEMARALFSNFPGKSGETVLVKPANP
ncbi:DUF4136 domain-containing protein [Novosphingobium flavum]|uniref:DUF4136 domain-containing protein n=1 Tax=Novosphingobium flavum TaxID=1778672 RepID=A0A7X1KN18_9SPHN|nr:DUF4136 domain-containing protein [Novosphingobium flavum]MBC2666900.1 DUF4136 domain-containing protein [Novosphingobium flavum]